MTKIINFIGKLIMYFVMCFVVDEFAYWNLVSWDKYAHFSKGGDPSLGVVVVDVLHFLWFIGVLAGVIGSMVIWVLLALVLFGKKSGKEAE